MFYILIDDLFNFAARYRSLTGIQRVIVEVIKQLCMAFGHDKVRILSWNEERGFIFYSSTFFTPDYVYDQGLFCDYFGINSGAHDISLDNYIKSRYSGRINSSFHKYRYKVKNFFDGGKTFKKRRIIDQDFSIEESNKFDPLTSDENITIYAPGAFWMPQLELLYSLRSRSAGKIKIIGQLYDLTPLKTPEFHDPPLVEIFGKSLEKFITSADGIISISNNTLKDLRSYADAKNLSLPLCPVVQLAHEFPLQPNQNAHISNAVRYVQRFPFVLSVGLLDGRKNNWSLARVWRQLDRDIGLNTPLLVFAGSLDRSNASLEKILSATGDLNGLAHQIISPTDNELASLYQNCLFSVYPSFYEGWGLPVGESLWFGKPVIASNTSSLPEVGGDMADYFDINDLPSLYRLCRKMIEDNNYRASRSKRINRADLRTWARVGQETMDALVSISESTTSRPGDIRV